MAKGGHTVKSGAAPRAAAAKSGAPAMRAAWALFDAGDKLAARREALKLLASSPSEADAEEARDLLTRLAPPPSFKIFALVAATLLLGLIGLAILRS